MYKSTVTFNNISWSVDVATTQLEIATGLSGQASIPARTGILFDMGKDVTNLEVNMQEMLFAIDIAFIDKNGLIVAVESNVQPLNNIICPETIQYFMEVNAGELSQVDIGQTIVTSTPLGIFNSPILDALFNSWGAVIMLAMVAGAMRLMINKKKSGSYLHMNRSDSNKNKDSHPGMTAKAKQEWKIKTEQEKADRLTDLTYTVKTIAINTDTKFVRFADQFNPSSAAIYQDSKGRMILARDEPELRYKLGVLART